MQNDAWVRIYSDVYDDNIVGNKEGLLQLRKSIEIALTAGEASPEMKTDFTSVVCTNDTWQDEENLGRDKSFFGGLMKLFFVIWVIALPIIGIVALTKYFTS